MPGGFKHLSEVHAAFFGLFGMDAPKPSFTADGLEVAVRFYNRGGGSDAQDQPLKYPVVSIQDFPPELDKMRRVRVPTTYGGDFQQNDKGDLVGREVPFALPLNFRYQVSAATKKNSDMWKIQEWFMQHFNPAEPQMSLLLDQTPTQYGPLGEPVPYTLKVRPVPREDKIFEQAYDFELKAWVNVLVPSKLLPTFNGEIDVNALLKRL